jgi:hypothetical protein
MQSSQAHGGGAREPRHWRASGRVFCRWLQSAEMRGGGPGVSGADTPGHALLDSLNWRKRFTANALRHKPVPASMSGGVRVGHERTGGGHTSDTFRTQGGHAPPAGRTERNRFYTNKLCYYTSAAGREAVVRPFRADKS